MIGLSLYVARLAHKPRRKYPKDTPARQRDRIAALAGLISASHYGFTRAGIASALEEFYGQDVCSDAYVQIGRDLRTLKRVLADSFDIPDRWPMDGSGRVTARLARVMTTEHAIIAQQLDSSAGMILANPIWCPGCCRMRFFIISRNGRMLCVHCERKEQ